MERLTRTVLFSTLHVLNRKWFGAITKGKYSPERWFRTGVDVLLLAFMVLQPLSGILMSKHLYTFLPALPVSALARSVHMLLAYWGYVLLSVHAGTHLVAPLKRLMKKSCLLRKLTKKRTLRRRFGKTKKNFRKKKLFQLL